MIFPSTRSNNKFSLTYFQQLPQAFFVDSTTQAASQSQRSHPDPSTLPANQPDSQLASQQASEWQGQKKKTIALWHTDPMPVRGESLLTMSEIGEDSSEKLEDQQHTEDSPTAKASVFLPADPSASAMFNSEQEEMLFDCIVPLTDCGLLIVHFSTTRGYQSSTIV